MSTALDIARRLASASEARDPYARGHAESVSRGAVTLARELGYRKPEIERVELAALLHDVGNIDLDPEILSKPGRLSSDEFSIVQSHPVVGARIVGSIPSLAELAPIVESHHERWDGLGYPNRLRQKEIPEESRIVAIAETFDAITSRRPHRTSFSPARAVVALKTAAGQQLDPQLTEAFVSGIRRLVPDEQLTADEGVLSLDDVVREEKDKLRHAYVSLTQSLFWIMDRLFGHAVTRKLQAEVNSTLRVHHVGVRLREGVVLDFNPSQMSPDELAECYRAAIADQIRIVERLIGSALAVTYLRAAINTLSQTGRDTCHSYRLCEW